MPVPKIYHATEVAATNLRFMTGPIRRPQDYVNQITKSAWWQARCPYGLSSVTVTEVPDTDVGGHAVVQHGVAEIVLGHGRVNANRVAVSDPWVILHEMAHLLVEDPSDGHHGPRFVRGYIDMVERYLGTEAASELMSCCKADQIRINYRSLKHLISS